MKKLYLFFAFVAGGCCSYAQKENNIIGILIESYEEYYNLNKKERSEATYFDGVQKSVCLPEPGDFYNFFNTQFVDFSSLREENIKTFSFSDNLCSPLKQKLVVTSEYGMRGNRKHYGVDFRVNIGDTICSIFCGKVRIAKYDEAYGYLVVVRHYNMSETVYAHLSEILVDVNQEVIVGEIIGLGGDTGRSTGPHLHFELRYKGYPINPILNSKFLKQIPIYTP